jgi:16S rRNA (guanine(527)-N(7))-methyltransferase RsmG
MINKQLFKNEVQQLNIALDDTAVENFDTYATELVEWNKKMNLTAITEPDDIVIKHFVDCLMLLKYVDIPQNSTLIDVGTGAGFPAVPIKIARNDIQITLMDSLNKRLVFLEDVLSKCSLDCELIHSRAEDLGKNSEYRESYDIATARAVAPLNILSEYCLPFVKVGGLFVALKGSSDEVTTAQNAIKELGGEIIDNVSYKLSNSDPRSIVIIKKISQTPTKYPRKSKKISSQPL